MIDSLTLRPPGAIGIAMVVAGIVGAIVGLIAAALNRRRAGFFLGMGALLLATIASGLGALDVVLQRAQVDRQIAQAATETTRLRMRRAGYERAQLAARSGLVLGAAPLLGGLAGVLAPLMRRRKPRPQSMRMPRSLRSHARHELGSKTGAASLSASVLTTLTYAVCAVAWTIPLPEPAIPPDDPAWDAREAIDTMRAGRTREGCDALEKACEKTCDPGRVPYLGGAVSECFELRLEEAEADESPDGAARIEALSHTSLPLSAEQRERVRQESASRAASAPVH